MEKVLLVYSHLFSCIGINNWTFLYYFIAGSASGAHHFDGKLQLLQPADVGALSVTPG